MTQGVKDERPRPRRRKERHLTVRSIRRERPDVRKLALVVQALADAQDEKEAEQEHKRRREAAP